MTLKKPLIAIVSVSVLMVALLSMDLKALVKAKDEHDDKPGSAVKTASAVSLESVSDLSKAQLSTAQRGEIEGLEKKLAAAPANAELQKQLAAAWDNFNQYAPAGFYYEALARNENTYRSWLKAGDVFAQAVQTTSDSLLKPALAEKTIAVYQHALEKDPKGLEAKTGLGATYVSASSTPMQGIQLLREVVAADPQNVKANMSLGLFSVQSGQFDKAIERFKTVIRVEPGPEVWFYLASSYENVGKKQDAIAAYRKSKELAADPGLSRFVDQKISELSN